MDLYRAFIDLPPAGTQDEFAGITLSESRLDFLAKSAEGCPVFLLHDSSTAAYSPAIEFKKVSVQFHSTCRASTSKGIVDGQFAVVSCDSSVPELFELFIRCFAVAVERLPKFAVTSDLETCIRGLFALFRGLARPNGREVNGLWAELFVISVSKDVPKALRAWHANQFERFDFSWAGGCLEVKATVSEQRQHDFALEQLQAPLIGSGFVASLLLQPMSGGVGVMDLARRIETAVAADQLLRQKLWQNIAEALGADFSDRLDRRFDPSFAERHFVIFAMDDVPAPAQPSDGRVTNIKFRADLSVTESSLVGSPMNVLASLFV